MQFHSAVFRAVRKMLYSNARTHCACKMLYSNAPTHCASRSCKAHARSIFCFFLFFCYSYCPLRSCSCISLMQKHACGSTLQRILAKHSSEATARADSEG